MYGWGGRDAPARPCRRYKSALPASAPPLACPSLSVGQPLGDRGLTGMPSGAIRDILC